MRLTFSILHKMETYFHDYHFHLKRLIEAFVFLRIILIKRIFGKIFFSLTESEMYSASLSLVMIIISPFFLQTSSISCNLFCTQLSYCNQDTPGHADNLFHIDCWGQISTGQSNWLILCILWFHLDLPRCISGSVPPLR